MRTFEKFSIWFLAVLGLTLSTNALPDDGKPPKVSPPTGDETDGNQPPSPQGITPVKQDKLSITIWTNGHDTYGINEFWKPQMCENQQMIEWDKMDVQLNFSKGALEENGKYKCPVMTDEDRCDDSVRAMCAQHQLKNDHKKMLEWYCCRITETSDGADKTCCERIGISYDMLNQCYEDPNTWKELVRIWKDEGASIFPNNFQFPAFVINNVFDEPTTKEAYKEFFHTTCMMYKQESTPSHCHKNK